MKIECKSFDLKDLTEGELSFIAECFFSEADNDFDSEYMALARSNFEKARTLFSVIAPSSEWYALRLKKCEDRLTEIEEREK